jgi:hypothetical protein
MSLWIFVVLIWCIVNWLQCAAFPSTRNCLHHRKEGKTRSLICADKECPWCDSSQFFICFTLLLPLFSFSFPFLSFSFPFLPFSFRFSSFFSSLFHIFSPKWHRLISPPRGVGGIFQFLDPCLFARYSISNPYSLVSVLRTASSVNLGTYCTPPQLRTFITARNFSSGKYSMHLGSRIVPSREYELMTEAHAKLSVVRNCSKSSLHVCLGEGKQLAGGG